MRLPVIIINDCWEYIIELELELELEHNFGTGNSFAELQRFTSIASAYISERNVSSFHNHP